MSTRKKSNNFIQSIFKQIWRFFDVATKAVFNRLLRSLLVLKRQSRLSSRAGFVLPTVVMVILVVILLTTAIMIRSFDRSKNASNVRVDQAVLKAATPAIDRARAKIDRLFSLDETELPGNTPSEVDIASVLEKSKYKLGDETQIQLTGDFGTGTPKDTSAQTLKSAWKFPVDTDNNGKFDTYTLYGIYFRNPNTTESRSRGTTEARALPQDDGQSSNCGSGSSPSPGWYSIGGQLKKAFFTYVANVPITDLSTLPTGSTAAQYEKYKGNKGFSALEMQLDQAKISLDNNAVWYNDDLSINSIPSLKLNGRVHTNSNLLVSNPGGNPINFLQVSSKYSCFYNPANAKIVVGGNFAAGDIGNVDNVGSGEVKVDLYRGQKINPDTTPVLTNSQNTTTKGPDDVAGNSDAYAQRLNLLVQGALDLHDQANQSAAGSPTAASVASMVGRYPPEVITAFDKKFKSTNAGSGFNALKQSLETYFANRIRRVSFAEIPFAAPPGDAVKVNGAAQTTATIFSAGGQITPPMEWMLIEDPSGNPNNYTKLQLNFPGGGMNMPATDPGTGAASTTKNENLIGDRIQVGNNLPNSWVKDATTTPVTFSKAGDTQPVVNGGNPVNWDNGGQRKRTGVAEQLDDLGDTSRNGYWEQAAAKVPPLDTEDLAGGLRVVTGAGIYVDGRAVGGTGTRLVSGTTPNRNTRSFLPAPTLDNYFASAINPATGVVDTAKQAALQAALPPDPIPVWPDTMPMYQWKDRTNPNTRKGFGSPGVPEQYKGDLQMRATVVYHYAANNPDEPIACISSYYDPTDPFTADIDPTDGTSKTNGISNNGVSYTPPTAAQRVASPRLRRQSEMVFPDGRWANKPLYDALNNTRPGNQLSLADKAAIDAANCALSILDNPTTPTPSAVPDGAIRERAFLDARQIKAVHKITTESDNTTAVIADTKLSDLNNPDHLKMASLGALNTDYALPLEQRQPLEVRVTEIDLGKLKTVKIGAGGGSGTSNTQEYLLPNSGIIYATRDDALPDLSTSQTPANNRPREIRNKKNTPSETAATDFQLDPTRRPNGIRLINGSDISRDPQYRTAEKGLILASDLPVYIKGDFNMHRPPGAKTGTLEEFTDKVDPTSSNFYTRSTQDTSFACRPGGPTPCTGSGDQWRVARILSDGITLLSDNFRDGYRYEGGYDLNNNAGNLAVEAFLKNGFWLNNFATTAKWYGTDGFPTDKFVDDAAGTIKKPGSSYVMNSVTPIQRRVDNFPEYKMEICTKLPASECGPQDWKRGNTPPTWVQNDPDPRVKSAWLREARQAGTTAAPTTTPPAKDAQYISEHYPRRVAFQRDPDFGQLVLNASSTINPINHAKPLPATGVPIAYRAVVTVPNPQPNSLWFATTISNTDPSAGLSYGKDNLLYYAKFEDETSSTTKVHERQLLLPGTPTFPTEIQSLDPAFAGQTVLNGVTEDDPSDFAVCNADKSSKLYQTTTTFGPLCPSVALARQMNQALGKLKIPVAPQDQVLAAPVTLDATAAPPTLTAPATKKVNVFDLTLPPVPRPPRTRIPRGTPRRQLANVTLTLDGSGQSDPIFIIRSGAGLGMRLENVQLVLKGVDPNNVFWSVRGPLTIAGAVNTSKLAGNFLGAGALVIEDGSNVSAGRFLGFSSTGITAGTLTALTTTAQPLVVPVLQLHSPTGQPDAPKVDTLETKWLQQAADTTFNAVLVMGDSPARPLTNVPNGAELNGGLPNLPRFLENWDNTVAKISGGFIQFKRSGVATAPFQAIIEPKTTDTALFFDGNSYPPALNSAVNASEGLVYTGGASGKKAPYYRAPDRQWGYDVGLLSQTPDLFSRRFTTPQADPPNEFFREVSRDDNWVKTLMCGKTVDPATGNATSISALPPGQVKCP